jgi:hypothetical protein
MSLVQSNYHPLRDFINLFERQAGMMVEPRIIDEAKSAYGKRDLVAGYILLLLDVLGCVAIKDLKRGVFGQANEAMASTADNIDLIDAILLHRSAMLCFDRMLREHSIVRPKEPCSNTTSAAARKEEEVS